MKGIIIHFIICTALFYDYFDYQKLYLKKFYHYKSSQISKLKIPIKIKKHRDFIKALLTGNKRSLKQHKEYQHIKAANMLHLLTPSGLHLSALTLPFYMISKSRILRLLVLALFSLFLFYSPGFEAAKRILALKSLLIFHPVVKTSFFIVFSLAYLFKPSLSFLMSYFFIGVILLNPFKRVLPSLGLFGAAQILICLFFESQYFPLSFMINPIGSLFVSLTFPLILITAFIPSLYQYSTYYIIEAFLGLTSFIYKIPPLFESNLMSIILILSFLSMKKWKLKFVCLLTLIYRPLISI